MAPQLVVLGKNVMLSQTLIAEVAQPVFMTLSAQLMTTAKAVVAKADSALACP